MTGRIACFLSCLNTRNLPMFNKAISCSGQRQLCIIHCAPSQTGRKWSSVTWERAVFGRDGSFTEPLAAMRERKRVGRRLRAWWVITACLLASCFPWFEGLVPFFAFAAVQYSPDSGDQCCTHISDALSRVLLYAPGGLSCICINRTRAYAACVSVCVTALRKHRITAFRKSKMKCCWGFSEDPQRLGLGLSSISTSSQNCRWWKVNKGNCEDFHNEIKLQCLVKVFTPFHTKVRVFHWDFMWWTNTK